MDGRRLEAQVCVVGAGPCGLALARALDAAGITVIVLESGGDVFERRIDRLSAGRARGDPYAGLRSTRRRRIGGTATSWNTPVHAEPGAKYVPLDPMDLQGPPPWPLAWPELVDWYRDAQEFCGLGPFDYSAAAHAGPESPPLELRGGALESSVYQLGRASVFTRDVPGLLRDSQNVTLCHHATLLELRPGLDESTVEHAIVGALPGARFRVHADAWVLAAGAVENARSLLLAAEGPLSAALSGVSSAVGAWFTEHPRDSSLVLLADRPFERSSSFYRAHLGAAGTTVLGRLAVSAETRRRDHLPNASLTFLRYAPRPRRVRGAGHPRLAHARRPPPDADPYLLLLNLEQRPHRDNRITLGRRRDAFGLRTAELRWRWSTADQAALDRLRGVVTRELEAEGLGRVVETTRRRPDPNAHHHAGTTRMSAVGSSGVVDASCCVHGMQNLYALGGSVFPTAGYANPTLTIVALALRAAAHLSDVLPR